MHTQLQAKPRVALDTNMLLAIQQLGIDVFSGLEKMFGKAVFAVPNQVFEELVSLEKEGKTKAKAVGIAFAEIKRHDVKKAKVEAKNADEALAKMAKQGYFIASNDARLRKRIKGFGGKVIYLRQGRFLKAD